MREKSPLLNSFDTRLVNSYDVKFLISKWKEQFNIDISQEMKGYTTINEFQCNITKLHFFNPVDVEGSPRLYKSLQNFEWYYMNEKWEHHVSIQRFPKNSKVLEIGCGQGEFIELCNRNGHDATGIELNHEAVRKAQENSLNVFEKKLDELSIEHPNSFDCVCAFQVLEHVSSPKDFIESCVNLLKPRGKLIYCVPNSDGLLATDFNLLDLPPHHMTRWNKQSFKSLENIFGIKLAEVYYEPLAEYHWDWYLSLISLNSKKLNLVDKFLIFAKNIQSQKKLLSQGFNKLIKGHTIFVEFIKK